MRATENRPRFVPSSAAAVGMVKEEIVRLTGRHRWAAILFATAIFSLEEKALRNAAASFVMGAGACLGKAKLISLWA